MALLELAFERAKRLSDWLCGIVCLVIAICVAANIGVNVYLPFQVQTDLRQNIDCRGVVSWFKVLLHIRYVQLVASLLLPFLVKNYQNTV